MKAGAILLVVALLVGCSTTDSSTSSESRPFYYFHTNYPEHMDNDAGCHGCRSRYNDEPERSSYRGFSERERNRRLQKLYGRMGR
jgi:uncharacterized protein YceK